MNYHTPYFFIKSKTNNDEFCKQYFVVVSKDNIAPSLIVKKLVLSEDFELYRDCKIIKTFKDKGLFLKTFGLKIDTLNKVLIEIDKYQ